MIDWIWPYLLMGAWAFAAATLLPISSEIVLLAEIKAGIASTAGLVAVATIGNVAGSLFNWVMGRYLRHFEDRWWFPVKADAIEAATNRFNRFGVWSLLLAWVPVIGDPLTLVAGVLRVPLHTFLPLVFIGKAARYIALAYWA